MIAREQTVWGTLNSDAKLNVDTGSLDIAMFFRSSMREIGMAETYLSSEFWLRHEVADTCLFLAAAIQPSAILIMRFLQYSLFARCLIREAWRVRSAAYSTASGKRRRYMPTRRSIL